MRPNRFTTLLAAGAVAFSLAGAGAARADMAAQQATVDHATGTLQDLRRDKEFGNARSLLHRARAVLIVPRLFKAGFFIGGEGGDAVLMVRSGRGWSDPAFYTIGSASFGLQIGAQTSELVLFIMSQRALDAVMNDNFKIGANAAISVVTLGSSVEAATTANVGADIIAWASSSGAYAGLTLNGSVIAANRDANVSYYGRPVTAREIVSGGVRSRAAGGLLRTIGSL
jgi:SH3 domain-containing YSC84-like protein 1